MQTSFLNKTGCANHTYLEKVCKQPEKQLSGFRCIVVLTAVCVGVEAVKSLSFASQGLIPSALRTKTITLAKRSSFSLASFKISPESGQLLPQPCSKASADIFSS